MNLANNMQIKSEEDSVSVPDIKIKNYTALGYITGSGKVCIEAREYIETESKNVNYFVKFDIQTGGDYPKTASIIVPYENINKLINSIDKMSKLTINTDRFAHSEIEYEINGFSIVVFNNDRGRLNFAVTVNSVSAFFPSMSDLETLKKFIIKAKEHIDRHRVEI